MALIPGTFQGLLEVPRSPFSTSNEIHVDLTVMLIQLPEVLALDALHSQV